MQRLQFSFFPLPVLHPSPRWVISPASHPKIPEYSSFVTKRATQISHTYIWSNHACLRSIKPRKSWRQQLTPPQSMLPSNLPSKNSPSKLEIPPSFWFICKYNYKAKRWKYLLNSIFYEIKIAFVKLLSITQFKNTKTSKVNACLHAQGLGTSGQFKKPSPMDSYNR